jgi:hydroxymethylglutaryl-CoA synthase
MAGIVSYATYLPAWRLAPADIGGRTDRVVAGFDEDSTTLAVMASTAALRPGDAVGAVYLATSTPAYADKTNAVAVHAALGLDRDIPAADLAGSGRSAMAAISCAEQAGGLVAMSDVRVGLPGGVDERGGGDAAAAFLFADGTDERPVLAEIVGRAASSVEVLDRWRSPDASTGMRWEERLGVEAYEPVVRDVVARALADAGVERIDRAVIASANQAVVKRAGKLVPASAVTTSPVGYSGTADIGVALAAALDVAEPAEIIVVVSVTDGADAVVLRTTDALRSRRQARPVTEARAGGTTVPYPTYLQWRGLLDRDLPRRPEPDRAAAPPSLRNVRWKFGLEGTRCTGCGFVHLPPMRVCRSCGGHDSMVGERIADRRGLVRTFTVDRLAFSPSPPVVGAVVDFDGGGRYTFEVADNAVDDIAVGAAVEMTFRRLYTAGGVHNYFWKARLVTGPEPAAVDVATENTAREGVMI